MAGLVLARVPTEFPMNEIYHNVTVYSKRKSNRMRNTTIMNLEQAHFILLQIWIKNDEENGFDFYLSDISQISYENDVIFMLLSSEDCSYMIRMMLHVKAKTAYKTLKNGIKLAKNPVVEEFPVLELPEGISPTAENIKFDRKERLLKLWELYP
ncbi:Protein of unknown function [Cotesia congregata]|uniref:Uncharacterized protein n=1 Tax=Cotesia congregata TaxID=51543 RepID=A0A8J2MLV2_COTCN|nr:Protein of unknown function [Cotesia congregata]